MTYCLGIYLPGGVVLASDSRSNAGVDQIAMVKKMAIFEKPGEHLIVVLSAGNLATSQAVVTLLRQGLHSGTETDLFNRTGMFGAAQLVGDTLNQVAVRYGPQVQPYGDVTASFLVGGQMAGERHRLFQVYPAGNFIEASPRNHFLQLGETKYGKPILDRALSPDGDLNEAARLALLSYDATMRSNLSVAPPIDMMIYERDSFAPNRIFKFSLNDGYFKSLRQSYSDGLVTLAQSLPPFPSGGASG